MWKPTLPPFSDFKKKTFSEIIAVSEFIHQIGENPLLRQTSSDVDLSNINSYDQQAKFQYLKDCLLRYRELTGVGRGITAIQVGIPENFSIIYTPEQLLVIVNPVVTKQSQKLLKYPEMCMSAQPIIAPTVRPSWIEFEYYDEKGDKNFWNTKDDTDLGKIMNRVFQHEIDHMDGIINIDRVKSPKELILESDPHFYDSATFEEI